MAIARANPGKRILVFGGSIAAVDRLAEIMRQHGLPAEAYHSQLDPEKSKQINTNEFAAWGRDFHVLFAVQKLDEGVDVPEAKIAVMLASGKGDLQMIQRTGRIMRPSKLNEPAQLYLIVASKTSEESLQHKTVQALELPADHVHVTTAKELFKQLSYTPENVLPSQ
jgi:superfamily II DNA or RNA helicase